MKTDSNPIDRMILPQERAPNSTLDIAELRIVSLQHICFIIPQSISTQQKPLAMQVF